MNLYFIKCSKFIKNSTIKIKPKTDVKVNLYSRCIDFSLKIFETIYKEKLNDLYITLTMCHHRREFKF